MKNEQIQEEIAKYFSGLLSSKKCLELENKIKTNSIYQQEYEAFLALEKSFENAYSQEVPKGLTLPFYFQINGEKIKKKKSTLLSTSISWAAGIALLILSYWIGSWKSNEVQELRNEVQHTKTALILMQLGQPVSSERIKAVQLSYDFPDLEEPLIEAIIHLLNHDSSVNVRLAAANALFRLRAKETVKKAMIDAFAFQSDPTLKIVLINMIMELDEQRAKIEVKQLLKDDNLPQVVKDRLNQTFFEL